MRLFARTIIPLLLALIFSVPVRAAFVMTSELPGSIQSCITAGACLVSNVSAYDSGTASAFQITQNTGSGIENNWLVRYSLVPPSGQSRLEPPVDDSFSGYLWMLAKDSYSASESAHSFTLYLDKVSPGPFSMFGQSGDLELFMPTVDLLAGSSYRTYGIDYALNSYDLGNLSGEVAIPCVAEGCETHAQLNLLQLAYADLGSTIMLTGFNPSDTRGLAFTQYETFPCYGDPSCAMHDVQTFYVSAVPIPAAAWLFGSGLAVLIGAMRRKSKH